MKTMEIIDPKKLAAAMEAAGLSELELAREMTRLANGKRRWSQQNVSGWTRTGSDGYTPHKRVVPYLQAALGVTDFSEIASPVEWPEDLPKPKKMKKGD